MCGNLQVLSVNLRVNASAMPSLPNSPFTGRVCRDRRDITRVMWPRARSQTRATERATRLSLLML